MRASDEEQIIRAAQLPAGRIVDRAAFERGIRFAIATYRDADTPDHLVRKAIHDLWKSAHKVVAEQALKAELAKALKAELAKALKAELAKTLKAELVKTLKAELAKTLKRLPKGARYLLNRRASRLKGKLTGLAPAERILLLTQSGVIRKQGRRRPGGKQSRPTVEPVLNAPKARRGRPGQEAAHELVMWLAMAYREGTGRGPSTTANARKRGPFVRLVEKALTVVGARGVNAVNLVNWYGAEQREAERRVSKDNGFVPLSIEELERIAKDWFTA